jgi:type II secretory pathway pseudopilin PulG
LPELVVTLAIMGLLMLVIVPNIQKRRVSAYNASAESFTAQVNVAQGAYRASNHSYAVDFDELTSVDKNILDTPAITFVWLGVNASGYTLNAKHAQGNQWYTAAH